MAAPKNAPAPIELTKLPVPIRDFIPYFSSHPKTPALELLQPYKIYESELRKVFAQQPSHEVVKDGLVNAVPVFSGHESELKVQARSLATESTREQECYIMPLDDKERKPDGSPAIVTSLKEFQNNFNLFSESSLSELNWNNIVAAGSAVTTALLPVPEKWAESKRSLREYYHEHLAPASDVDLFLYGLTEEGAREKIKYIERSIKDSLLHETTTIRTKNAITIASQYPTRHVQIVLRLYDSVSQIITGFDVDCACAAYDGKQVYASPRALVAFATQTNTVDLTRRSPSYENRLSKYSHRGFEVHWPLLDRSRIDPTIFERSFKRTNGLARLLVLEKLPKSTDRDAYMDQRRTERGRPPINRSYRNQHRLWGNIKEEEEDDVAEWVEEDEVSNYHTMVVPYGKKFNASKINKLLYTKDLLLNAEWNKPEDRVVDLHRHPCFFGTADDVLDDCCGFCPLPKTDEEKEIAQEESKLYISGSLSFIKDDPGRQEIGSFNPITTDDWCEMAYVGNTQMLCQAIVDGDVDAVETWCDQEGNDPNTRDYCGRTPLHLAVIAAAPTDLSPENDHLYKRCLEIVQCLIDHGARLVARLADGRTALHLAATQGNIEIVKALMKRSLANEQEEAEKEEKRKAAKRAEKAEHLRSNSKEHDSDSSQDDIEIDGEMSESENDKDSVTMGSFVKVEREKPENDDNCGEIPEDTDELDYYDIDILAWDFQTSPLHLAIINGHVDMIRLLVDEYGADPLLPIKLSTSGYVRTSSAILSLVLALSLPKERAKEVAQVLLELGATCAQADMNHYTALHYIVAENSSEVLDALLEHDAPAAQKVLNYIAMGNSTSTCADTPLVLALKNSHQNMAIKLLSLGAKATISADEYIKSYISKLEYAKAWNAETNMNTYRTTCIQPLIIAASKEMPKVAEQLLAAGADPSTLDTTAYRIIKDHYYSRWQSGSTILDFVRSRLKALREYREFNEKEPRQLQEESFYTSEYINGGYRYWTALHIFQEEKKRNLEARNAYEKRLNHAKEGSGTKEKREAISKLTQEFESLESALLAAGAKTFKELYPEIPDENKNSYRSNSANSGVTPFTISFSFNVPLLNDSLKEGYLRLFEAAWTNDIEEVKSLTLGAWTSNVDNIEHPPLQVAVKDSSNFSPFSIAVLRGHRKLARVIGEITLAQYEPEDKSGHRERWAMDIVDSEDGYDSESDGPNIFSEIVSDKFTIDNVVEISTTVKSRVEPLSMINWECNAKRFIEDDQSLPIDLKNKSQVSLMEYAVLVDDMPLLKFLLQISTEYSAKAGALNERSVSTMVSRSLFDTAIRAGRTAMLAELIRTTGTGISLDDLVQKSGVEIKEKPRYYQGLNVGGKKRTDWAQAGRSRHGVIHIDSRDRQTPLLRAAYFGNIESVQWFLSDAPLRRYTEFASANKADKRVQILEKSEKGFEGTIGNWLISRSELSLHCAIMWNPAPEMNEEYVALVRYIISAMPTALEHKSTQGFTPLHLAVAFQRPEIVELLISAGANQRVCDRHGRNVVHNMLVPLVASDKAWDTTTCHFNPVRLRELLQILDRSHVKEMLLERCTLGPRFSSLTPQAYWLKKNSSTHGRTSHMKPDVIKILTEYSGSEDMDLINGEGDLPLHQAVKQSLPSITSYLISVRPELLYRENATGRTALEMATDLYMQERVSQLPKIEHHRGDFGLNQNPGLIARAASSFLLGDVVDEVASKKRTYEICMEAAQKYPRKRKLVSLFDANEVAKRLAGLKTHALSSVDTDDHGDEVAAWVGESIAKSDNYIRLWNEKNLGRTAE